MGILVLTLLCGCPPPQPPPPPPQPAITGKHAAEIAQQMSPKLLSVPEIAKSTDIPLIAVSGLSNRSSVRFDSDYILNELITRFEGYSGGKARFINNNTKTNIQRVDWMKRRHEKQRIENLKKIAEDIASYEVFKKSVPVKIAVIPVINTNVVNMTGENFIQIIRPDIMRASKGKIQFLLPGTLEGADYYLTGQFVTDSIKTEGIINLANYIEAVDYRVKNGKSMYVVSAPFTDFTPLQVSSVDKGNTSITTVTPALQRISLFENHLKKILNDAKMQKIPDVNKYLNIIIVDAKTKASVYENRFDVEKKITDNAESARFILSGMVESLDSRVDGVTVKDVKITLTLTDMEMNTIIWQDIYKTKLQLSRYL